MKKLIITLGVVIVIYIILFAIPVTPKSIMYRSVTERDSMDHDVVGSLRLEGNPRGDYLVHNDKLYLNVQETQGALILVTFVSQTRWTAQKIQELRKAHPELEQYWPEPQAPDGGVKWIRENR